MAVEIPRESLEYLWWPVSVSRGSLSESTVEVALFLDPSERPGSEDWVTATLIAPEDEEFGDGENHYVRLLFGPGGEFDHQGAEGDYQSWVRVNSTPESVVRRPSVVTVT